MPEGSGADGAQSCSKCCLLVRQEAAGPQAAVRDKHGALRMYRGVAELWHSAFNSSQSMLRLGVQAGALMCLDIVKRVRPTQRP